jgi:hypothetical protein
MIIIDKEFSELLTPLTTEEFEGLENLLLKEGIRDAIVLWGDKIIDGHNRYNIAQKHNLPFKTITKDFNNKYEVIDWIYKNQLSKRNLTEEQKAYYIGKQYENEKMQSGFRSDLVANCNKVNTKEKIANAHNINESTVIRNAEFSKGIDFIGEVNPELKNKILQGEADFTKQEIQTLGKDVNVETKNEVKKN